MAIYHCSVKVIGRSAGRSAVACAAYRSGEKLHSEETDRTFDYSNKGGVVYSEIALCENAPERFLDRETLWNSVQAVENKSDSRLAREFEVALPLECSKEEWIEIGREYAAYMTEQGMIADWAIHDPVNKDTGIRQNPHIHMMCTTRPITKDGEWGAKEKKGYKLDANGQKIPVIDPKTGQQKIGAKGRKMWQREKVDATGWDNRSKVLEWRAKWSEVVNKHLAPEKHIDHRSYKDQGIDRIPTIHEGYVARKIDKQLMAEKGEHAELVQKNIEIRKQNEMIQALHEMIANLKERAGALYDRYKEQVRELGRSGNVFDRLRRSLGIVKAGESGVEQRKRGLVSLIGAFERRERDIKQREPEVTEVAEAIGNRAAEKVRSQEKAREISQKWAISGSAGLNLQKEYEEVGKQIISHNLLGAMRSVSSTDYRYDSKYIGLVYIIQPSHVKKVEKALQNTPHKTVGVNYQGRDMIAVICNGDHYELNEKMRKVPHRHFYLYLDHKKQEMAPQVRKPSMKEQIAQATQKARELEKERPIERKHKPKEIDEPEGPTWGGMSL